MKYSALLILLSIFTSLVTASNGAKGYQTVAHYYAYSLEWLAHSKDTNYVATLAAPCRDGDCSTFAKFLKANMKPKALKAAGKTGMLNPGGPFDINNPDDETARKYNTYSALTGNFDNEKMYGAGTPDQESFSEMAKRIGDTVNRARVSLGGEGQDIVDKIAHLFEEVVTVRKAELSPDKLTDIKNNNKDIVFKMMANNSNEIDWLATLASNPSLQEKNGARMTKLRKSFDDFDKKTYPSHAGAIRAATDLVNRLRAPPFCG